MPKRMPIVRRSDDDIIATRSLKPGASGAWAAADGKVTIAKARALYDSGLAEMATGRVGDATTVLHFAKRSGRASVLFPTIPEPTRQRSAGTVG